MRYRNTIGPALVAMVLLGSAPHRATVRLFGADRVKHFFLSFFVQSASYSVLRTAHVSGGPALAGAAAATIAVGVGKELCDRHAGKAFDLGDLAWDALGAGAASGLLVRTVGHK